MEITKQGWRWRATIVKHHMVWSWNPSDTTNKNVTNRCQKDAKLEEFLTAWGKKQFHQTSGHQHVPHTQEYRQQKLSQETNTFFLKTHWILILKLTWIHILLIIVSICFRFNLRLWWGACTRGLLLFNPTHNIVYPQ